VNNLELYEKFKNHNKKELNQVLIEACYDGKLEIIKYVLESEYLKEHANIHYNHDNPFIGFYLKNILI
jgi:hypothetical protein